MRRLAGAAIAGALLLSSCQRTTPPPEPRNLNVLLITLDTTRADHLSCYADATVAKRQRGARTPHLDSLAARGIRFSQAIAQVPLTLPSHACMFTGVYPEVHQLRDMGGFILDKRHLTLASMARQAGFATAAFVGSKAVGRQFGLQQGFDVYDDLMKAQDEENKLPGVFPERRAGVTTDRALEWLRQNGQQKFFLWVHYYDPHAPYDPPEPYQSAYPSDPYSGEIAYTDEQVGRLLQLLDQQGLREKTLVVSLGDHGEGLNDHGEETHGIFIYDDTLRIPWLMAGPGVPAGKVIKSQVRTIDLLPTISEFLNLPSNAAAQGVSLWPLMARGQPETGKGSNYAYLETLYPKTYMNWSELRGMRTDRWKFILAPHPELYDLERDPAETENVVARHPAEADHLQKKIWEVVGPASKNQTLSYAPVDQQTRQELESLGYVSAGAPREIVLNMSGPDPKDRVSTLRAMQQYDRFMKHKAYGKAARALESILPSDSRNALAHLYLASAYEKLRDWKRAIQIYRHAIELGISTDQILARLGKAYVRVKDTPRATEAMEKAAKINPTDLDNLRNLGIAYLDLGRVSDAERTFKAIVVQDDHYAAAYNGLGLVGIQRGDGNSARVNFERALDLDPEQLEPLYNLGVLYLKTGHRERALRYLEMFLRKASPRDYGHLMPQVRETVQDLKRGA